VPEGDTIYRAARTLNRAMAGQAVERFITVFPALMAVQFEGRTIEGARSAGKHLLMEFSGGLVLRTHMRMNGSWHLYHRGERWKRPRADMRIVITTAALEAVGFSIPVAEIIPAREVPVHGVLKTLGPDLLAEEFDEDEAVRRMRAAGDTAVADVLLDQRVLAGIGNVYKSEVLFACRVNPFAPASDLDDDTLRQLAATARRLLVANTSETLPAMTTYGGFRRTTGRDDPAARLWVYGRSGKPCRRCGTAIRMRRQGPHARSTYWCERCQ
jgi:endonuclease-8